MRGGLVLPALAVLSAVALVVPLLIHRNASRALEPPLGMLRGPGRPAPPEELIAPGMSVADLVETMRQAQAVGAIEARLEPEMQAKAVPEVTSAPTSAPSVGVDKAAPERRRALLFTMDSTSNYEVLPKSFE